jgi:hypothetical protein
MDKERQLHLAEDFRARHRAPHLLLLANAWDALSARIVEEAGFDAVATTSGGVNWVLGYADGEAAPWSEVVAATARMARVLRVPLTADIEAGYGGSPAEVAKSVGEIITAGAVGINLEDGTGRADAPMLEIDEAASRIRAARNAAREAAVPIVINARIDIYLKQIGDPASRFAETVRRAEAYLAAGGRLHLPLCCHRCRHDRQADPGDPGAHQHRRPRGHARRGNARATRRQTRLDRFEPRHDGDRGDPASRPGASQARKFRGPELQAEAARHPKPLRWSWTMKARLDFRRASPEGMKAMSGLHTFVMIAGSIGRFWN